MPAQTLECIFDVSRDMERGALKENHGLAATPVRDSFAVHTRYHANRTHASRDEQAGKLLPPTPQVGHKVLVNHEIQFASFRPGSRPRRTKQFHPQPKVPWKRRDERFV